MSYHLSPASEVVVKELFDGGYESLMIITDDGDNNAKEQSDEKAVEEEKPSEINVDEEVCCFQYLRLFESHSHTSVSLLIACYPRISCTSFELRKRSR